MACVGKNKMVSLFVKLFMITVLLFFTIGPSQAADDEKINVLVGFHHSPDVVQIQQLAGDVYREFDLIDAVAVRLPSSAIRALEKNPAVKYVEPDEQVHALGTEIASAPSTIPWGVDRIFGDEVYPFPTWDESTGTGIAVAVIDTGIDKNHQDLPELTGGVNYVDDTHWGRDDNGHGTHVAGTIAAQTSELPGISPGIDLYSIKALDETGAGTLSAVIDGIEWAVKQEIPIMNLSLGLGNNNTALKEVCQAAFDEGHLLIAAAGNEGESSAGDNVMYPAAYSSVIAVSASDSSDEFASFSSSGPEVELIAPGDGIKSTMPPLPVTDTIHVGQEQYKAQTLVGTGVDTVTGPLVDCGLAIDDDFYVDIPGGDWIALIDRGEITFADKVRNVMEKGAAAAIIVNNDENKPDDKGEFTLYVTDEDREHDWIPTVSVSLNSGKAIRDGQLSDGKVSVEYGGFYKSIKGTSMAAPHVTGAAALVWSANQELTQIEIREILQDSAEDLGLVSQQQGYGLARADRAVAKALEEAPLDPEEYTLDIDIEGKGMVLVEGENVDLPYTNDYEEGAEVELTAYPEEGWEFEKWLINGKERLSLNTELIMEADKTVMAYFEKIEEDTEWIILPSPEEEVALDKSWQVIFNRTFSKDEIDGMVIEREKRFISVDIQLLPEEGQAIVTPVEDYLPGKTYNLRIFLNNLNRYKMYFTTEEDS